MKRLHRLLAALSILSLATFSLATATRAYDVMPASDPETRVRIFNVNTQALVEAIVQTPKGKVTYEGNASIDGVPGTAAPVGLNFTSAIGSVTGKLLPTGKPLDVIDGVDVSCVDVAMPMILMPAEQLAKTGHETAAQCQARGAIVRDAGLDAGQREPDPPDPIEDIHARFRGRLGTKASQRRELSTMILWRMSSLTPAARSLGRNTVRVLP